MSKTFGRVQSAIAKARPAASSVIQKEELPLPEDHKDFDGDMVAEDSDTHETKALGSTDISLGWSELGATRGFDPVPLERATFCIKARRKSGLSTLMGSRDGALIIDFDNSNRNVRRSRATRIFVPAVVTLDNILARLETDRKTRNMKFNHIIIDPLDGLVDLLAQKFKALNGMEYYEADYGKGHDRIKTMVSSILSSIYNMGYGWTVCCHLDIAEANVEGDKTFYLRDSIAPKSTQWVSSKADYLLQLNIEKKQETKQVPGKKAPTVITSKVRVLTPEQVHTRTASDESLDPELGTRIPLPSRMEIPMFDGWSVIEKAWKASVKAAQLEDSNG